MITLESKCRKKLNPSDSTTDVVEMLSNRYMRLIPSIRYLSLYLMYVITRSEDLM